MYAPQWVWVLPLVALAPLSFTYRRRGKWLVLLVTLGAFWSLAGPCIPWRSLFAESAGQPLIRVMSVNADHRRLEPLRLQELLADVQPDVVFLQDVSSTQMATVFVGAGWHTRRDDGLYVASRFPLKASDGVDLSAFGPPPGEAACYDIETPEGVVRCFNVHLATPRWALLELIESWGRDHGPLEANSDLRRRQSRAIRDQAAQFLGPVMIVGDFNSPVTSTIFRECWSSYSDAFSVAGWGWGNTHFTRRTGLRIDHVLASADFRVQRCWVGPHLGSAHRPLVAELQLAAFAEVWRPRW
jgi:endonuclease/exonuclease/phosphatase (EEP) superfamily protein YafD